MMPATSTTAVTWGGPQRAEAKCCVERIITGACQRKRQRRGGIQQWQLDAVGEGQQAVLPVHRDDSDDHDRDDRRARQRLEQSERKRRPPPNSATPAAAANRRP